MTDENKKLETKPYKGVRDFYPDDMAVQRYIFSVWEQTAESFGFEQYEASVLEPSELYKAKGSANEEMVNEQTYTFVDRGEREVTLRPEMTPTVARMVAGKQRTLTFPLRWYSIPNLFRYERTQRGRLREHWQLNCDIFGSDDVVSDIEIIALAHQIFLNFGADESMFEIKVNNRADMNKAYSDFGIIETDKQTAITRLNDRKDKISDEVYDAELLQIVSDEELVKKVKEFVESNEAGNDAVIAGLRELGITNVRLDRSLARGFDYYTSTVFEIYDTDPENNRAMMGGGRYDNLTAMFSDEQVAGVGFGFGDVTLKNFLESHDLLTAYITSPTLMIVPVNPTFNLKSEKIAQDFRITGIKVATDISARKIAKKIGHASDALVEYVLVVGEDEITTQKFTLKNLADGKETMGTIEELTTIIKQN